MGRSDHKKRVLKEKMFVIQAFRRPCMLAGLLKLVILLGCLDDNCILEYNRIRYKHEHSLPHLNDDKNKPVVFSHANNASLDIGALSIRTPT